MNSCTNKKYNFPHKNWLFLLNVHEKQWKKASRPTYSNLYAYAANNPVRYIDPDGNYLIKKDDQTKKIALNNKNRLYNSPNMAWALGQNENFYPAYTFSKIELNPELTKAINKVQEERAKPSIYTKTMFAATCKKIDNVIYEIIIVTAILTQTKDGLEFSTFYSDTVAYATAYEVGISVFNSEPVQGYVNYIANEVLKYAKIGISVDEN